MTPPRPSAATRTRSSGRPGIFSDCDGRWDRWLGVVALKREVIVSELEQISGLGKEYQAGQGPRYSRELELCLLDVICVEVNITQAYDELTGDQMSHGCYHHCQKRVARNVEGQAQEHVGAALVELAAEL